MYNIDGSENEKYQVPLFESDVVRLALKERGVEKAEFQLLDEIIYLEVFHNDIMWQILQKGIMIADKKYILFSAAPGQVRKKIVTLVREDFYKRNEGALLVSLTKESINAHGGMNVGKFLSYTSLPLSLSVLPKKTIDIDRCILVKGLETIITDYVKYIDIQENEFGQHYVANVPQEFIEKSVTIEHTDGAGMFLPGELTSSCQIRGGYFKGALFPFDFKSFAKEVAHNTIISDAWGNTVDIEEQDIRFIFTTSQLKAWKQYSSWEDYKMAFKDNEIKLSINSYANPAKDTVTFSYQYLQTLPYGCDIKKLCAPAKDDLIRLHKDIEYVKEALGYSNDSETELDDIPDNGNAEDNGSADNDVIVTDNIQTNNNEFKKSCNSLIAEALNTCPQLINDSYIKEKIKQLVKSRRKSYMAGKIPLGGYYSYVAPDMYAFCEYLFCDKNNPMGLVPKNHIYNKHYDEKGNVEHLVCLRSPHLSGYEYGKRNLIKTDECRKWFKYMESDTVVSCHDLLSKTLQMDWDGDEILVSDDAELYKLAANLPDVPLYYDMQQAEPQQINNETIYDTLVKGFDNNVIGDSSNAISKLWNTPEATKDNPIPYDDAINVFCAYSNYAIDYPKTGKNLELGEYGELYKKLVPPKTGKDMFKKPEILPPNFFIEAKGKKSKNVANPTKSVMDRIKQYIGKGTGRLDYTYFDNSKCSEFDYRMLMNNDEKEGKEGKAKYEVDRYDEKYQKLYIMLKHRKNAKRLICKKIDEMEHRQNTDSMDRAGKFDIFHYYCVQEIKKIFTNKEGWFNENLAVNYFVDMEYSQHDFVTSSKDILWKCFGHVMLENLQKNVNGGKVNIKFRPRMAYLKAIKGDEELNQKIAQSFKKHSIDIMSDEWEFVQSSLQKYKNGNYHNNDMELLFVLYCFYKDAKETNRLKDGYLVINQRKHVTNYDPKCKKRKKQNIKFNMNKIMKIAGVKSYDGSFKRFNDVEKIEIINDAGNECFKVKIDIPRCQGQKIFAVTDVYNSMVYLQAYLENKKICQCKVCGKDFVKQFNNQKTCEGGCSDELHRLNQARTNEKNRKRVI